jgi:hypothetical protein
LLVNLLACPSSSEEWGGVDCGDGSGCVVGAGRSSLVHAVDRKRGISRAGPERFLEDREKLSKGRKREKDRAEFGSRM